MGKRDDHASEAEEEILSREFEVSEADFASYDGVLQIGVAPVRIDILTSITGVSWSKAYRGKVKGRYGKIPVYFLGRIDYIRNKRSIGRRKDDADIEALGEI